MIDEGVREALVGIATQVVTWSLVIVGWLVVVDQAEYRELSKIAIARINALRDLVRKIEEDALAFHSSDYSESVANSILRKIKKFSDEVSDLHSIGLVSMTIGMSASDLRQSVTLNNFDSSSHEKLSGQNPIFDEIQGQIDRIDAQLMRAGSVLSCKPRRLRTTFSGLMKRV